MGTPTGLQVNHAEVFEPRGTNGVQTPFNYTNHELLSCLHNLCSIVTEEILFSSCRTSSNALQWHAIRQDAQEGLVQVQTVAPRSIKAQLRCPGLIASTNCCVSILP
jgi:hypothetical protein